MATAGGTAPQDTPKPKKEFTDEQKRTFTLLGVMGVLALVVAVMYVPKMLGGGAANDLPVAPAATTATDVPGATPPVAEGGAVPGAPAGAEAGVAPTLTSAGTSQNAFGIPPKHRSDPFVNFVKIPPPLPLPDPPIEVPAPEVITIERPVAPIDATPLNLPSVNIPRFAAQTTSPRDAFVPPRVQGGSQPEPSYNKRLSGVVIANGVRALLEIDGGPPTGRTYVVQPGDTVDGITVLNIQRITDGGRNITRMLIREGGQEKYVELKAGPPRTDMGAAGAEGMPGFPGGAPGFAGGMPGFAGGFSP